MHVAGRCHAARVLGLCGLGLLFATAPSSPAAVVYTEAEHLILLGDAGSAYTNDYKEARGGESVYLRLSTLTWRTNLSGGAFRLWVRARSGWMGDRTLAWSPKVLYAVKVAGKEVPLESVPDTLEFAGDGHNFMWGKSELLDLAQGEHTVEISCPWEWAHVDAMLFTDDLAFRPDPSKTYTSLKPLLSRWAAWPTSPYQPVSIKTTPPDDPAETMATTVPPGGTAILACNVHCLSDSRASTHIATTLSALKSPDGTVIAPAHCRLFRLAYHRTRLGQVAGDPLLPLNSFGAFIAPVGETAHLWLTVDTRGVPPGTYTGALGLAPQFTLDDESRRLPIEIRVADVALPDRTDLAVFNWWGYWNSDEPWWETQIAGGTNVFKATVRSHVGFGFDDQGNPTRPLDFTRLDTTVDRVKQVDGQLLVEWYLHAKQFAALTSYAGGRPLDPYSPAWEKAFRSLAAAISKHLLDRGLTYRQFAHYTFDEYLGPDFVRVGKILRELDPQVRIFSDRTAALEEYRAAAPYIDIWCPHYHSLAGQAADGRLAFMRGTGKDIWAYDEGHGQRTRNPYGFYRLKPWLSWKYRLQGCTYWKFQGDDVGIVYYPRMPGAPPVTSRRWEAWKKGLQDYRTLEALRERGVDGAVLDAAVGEVLSATTDTTLADRVLARLLQGAE